MVMNQQAYTDTRRSEFQPATFLSACPQSGVQVQRVTERTESETAGRQAVQSALAPCPDTSFPESNWHQVRLSSTVVRYDRSTY